MIEFIRQNPTTALSVHRHLTQAAQRINSNFNLPIESSTPQTPKRNLDTSENDDVQVFKQQRVLSNGKQRNDGHVNPSKTRNTVLPLENNDALNQSRHPAVVQNQDHLPFEQLKRAVSSNLPCFLMEYSEDINAKKRPSDLTAASAIKNHFNQRGMQIKFSLVGHVVVRYVPLQYNNDFISEEIVQNIQSAENIRRIQYRFQRKTNDFRFVVKDLGEYNSVLKLGHISIGNTFCTITPFLAGNRMTFCTRCWCIGHMRAKCNSEHPRCRICLNNITDRESHICSNITRCAQCDDDHHSLSNLCGKIVEYRALLKQEVDNALSTGKLQRLIPQDRHQPVKLKLNSIDFPTLSSPSTGTTPWRLASAQSHTTTSTKENEESTRIF
ncbi:unnamed protein product [Rotaria magnacalcarata]|uniref:Uncharacterized protein n=2 Tax=Rotaria magnacalcarata TaxID=392030 RepID=A0A8S2U9M8_9BILA|nr:unnamed protein product [Rotaria magnacalcarata]